MSSRRGKNNKLQQWLGEYLRVFKLAKKPGKKEYLQVAKISAAGILLLGAIGFTIYLGMGFLPQSLANMGKGQINANFVDDLNTSNSSQQLTLQLSNPDSKAETGALNLEFEPILCNTTESSIEVDSISPGGTRNITIEMTNINQNSNLGVKVWGENLTNYDSSSNPLEVYAIDTQGF